MHATSGPSEADLVRHLVVLLTPLEGMKVVQRLIWRHTATVDPARVQYAYCLYRLAVVGVNGLHAATAASILRDALAQGHLQTLMKEHPGCHGVSSIQLPSTH